MKYLLQLDEHIEPLPDNEPVGVCPHPTEGRWVDDNYWPRLVLRCGSCGAPLDHRIAPTKQEEESMEAARPFDQEEVAPPEVPSPRPRLATDAEVEEARRRIAAQASTVPADGDIGPGGAWERAKGVVGVDGRSHAHDSIGGPLGFPSINREILGSDAPKKRGWWS
jgi:hypothetical protein